MVLIVSDNSGDCSRIEPQEVKQKGRCTLPHQCFSSVTHCHAPCLAAFLRAAVVRPCFSLLPALGLRAGLVCGMVLRQDCGSRFIEYLSAVILLCNHAAYRNPSTHI